MKETGILFSAPMVRACLDGTKTQTRRIADFVPFDSGLNLGFSGLTPHELKAGYCVLTSRDGSGAWNERTHVLRCPYGTKGDRLYGREAWRTLKTLDKHSGSVIAELCLAAGYSTPWAPIQYEADGYRRDWMHVGTTPHRGQPESGRYRHARFMPRWASRITLEITGVRVERLHAISDG